MSNYVGSGSSGKRTRSEDGGSTPTTPTSGDVRDDHSPCPDGNKKVKARLKGKSQTSEAIEAFSSKSSFSSRLFRRRFRMQKHVFERIINEVMRNDKFDQKRDCTGRFGLSPLQKCTAAIRQLAYGCAFDACNEYIRISDSTTRLTVQRFIDGVNQFSNVYLRQPNETDLRRLLRIGEKRGFPGMIGSIDCMHWEWKNCPTTWRGQYQGRAGVATLVLEACS
ncbi:uncharacterized protein LOC125496487 [Beta vulgaris subsp. vulgaris]|uniref:uncharacterized protein LOC125496487 n=1 Tax=Beta vulgaris subsp. vulgaris TaxID=3555 RepID=UPI0020370381|nr:uncharacterized protein LOC125496487 [Beta vulgaris subsp. vulgaris]